MTVIPSRRAVLGAAALGGGALAMPALLSRPAWSADATIDVIHSWSGADHPFQRLVRLYNDRRTGVTVVARQEGTTYEAITQKAMAGIAAGRPPVLMTTGWKLADFARRTLGARDLRATFGADRFAALADNLRPQVMEIVTVDGANVGLPFAMSTPILYVNMELWRKAGLDPDAVPDTAEALFPAIRTLQDRTGRNGIAFEVNEWETQSFIQNAGGDVIDGAGRPAMDSAAAIAGMERFVQPRRDGTWRVLSVAELAPAFQAGAVGVVATSSARLGGIRQAVNFELRTARFPGLQGHARRMNSGGNFLGLYTGNREQQDGAYDFMRWLVSPDAFAVWLDTGYLNLTRHSLKLREGTEAADAQLSDGLTAETIWPGPRGLEALQVHIDWVSRMVSGSVSVPDGLRGSRQAVERLLSA